MFRAACLWDDDKNCSPCARTGPHTSGCHSYVYGPLCDKFSCGARQGSKGGPHDQFGRRAVKARVGGEDLRDDSGKCSLQSLRTIGNHYLFHMGGHAAKRGFYFAYRASDCEHAGVHPGCRWGAGTGRSDGGTVYRRGGGGGGGGEPGTEGRGGG